MAKAQARPLPAEPEVILQVTPVAQEALEVVKAVPPGPVIEYIGEGAEKVQFTINPNAIRMVVRGDGQIVEYL